jgi:uncharacterized membrane protein
MEELLLWLVLLGWAPPFLRRWLRRFGLGVGAEDSALETLRRRYASGEITRAQFEEMQEVLAQEASGEQARREP